MNKQLNVLFPQLRALILPWESTDTERKTLNGFTWSFLGASIISIILALTVELPDPNQDVEVPEALINTVLQERQDREEQAKEREQAAEEEVAVEEAEEAEEDKKEPTVDEKADARERAKKEGLAALSSELEDISSFSDDESFQNLGLSDDLQSVTTGVESGTDDGSDGGGLLALDSNTAGSGNRLVTNRGAIRGGSAGGLRKGTAGVSSGIKGRAGSRVGGGGRGAKAKKAATLVGGGRTAEEIQIVFDTNKGLLDRVYQKALRSNPSLKGEVLFELTIAPAGNVLKVKIISSQLNDPALEQKMTRRILVFQFGPKASSAGNAVIRFPINFLPSA